MGSKVKMSDAVLVSKFIAGNEGCLAKLIDRHQQRIFGHIYNKVQDRDIANDIFQDAFIKIINTLKSGKYNEEGKFLPWALRIAHNLTIDFFRKEKRIPVFRSSNDEFDVFDVIPSETINKEEVQEKEFQLKEVAALVDFLPEEQKQVLKMRIYMDLSFKEIAEMTGVSINTALGRMRYALINMRKLTVENEIFLYS